MKTFTGWQWLLIDAANQFGLDKLTFEERIHWADAHEQDLEALSVKAETVPLYMKAVMAIRKARQGTATGHMVGVDACCSGMQIMSAMTGCVAGARATGMVDPNRRADAYQEVTDEMQVQLNGQVQIPRGDAKQAVMTSLYASRKVPKDIFGEDTPELQAFYDAMLVVAPGAWELLHALMQSWQDYALTHDWKLPDGFDAKVKVMAMREARIEVDELNHASFTYQFYENTGLPKGHPKSKSNVANLVHSMDAYVLREMHRRCNYDTETMEYVSKVIEIELIKRNLGEARDSLCFDEKVDYYRDQYIRSSLASAVILPHLDDENVKCLSLDHLQALATIVNLMVDHKSFPLVTVHDEFKAHANNINQVRRHYREILAEIADSNVLDDLLTQLFKEPVNFHKRSFNLGAQIRQSNYALT
jgi:hypothetical protein